MRRLLKDQAKGLLEACGVFVSRWPSYLSSEYHLRDLLRRFDIDLVIDVGAYLGTYGQTLRRLGYRGEIVSFEPTPSSFERLGLLARNDKQWRVEKIALGARNERVPLQIWPTGDMNSLAGPSEYGLERFGAGSPEFQRIDVEVRQLDDVLDASDRRVLLKIDAQGRDFEVLSGARRTMSSVCALQIELPLLPCYEGTPSFEEALARLRTIGLEVTGIYSVSRDDEQLRLGDVDCFLIPTK